jgi:hypothetical protein
MKNIFGHKNKDLVPLRKPLGPLRLKKRAKSSPTVVRQAHQPWFDRPTNHCLVSQPIIVRQANQPWTCGASAGQQKVLRNAKRFIYVTVANKLKNHKIYD